MTKSFLHPTTSTHWDGVDCILPNYDLSDHKEAQQALADLNTAWVDFIAQRETNERLDDSSLMYIIYFGQDKFKKGLPNPGWENIVQHASLRPILVHYLERICQYLGTFGQDDFDMWECDTAQLNESPLAALVTADKRYLPLWADHLNVWNTAYLEHPEAIILEVMEQHGWCQEVEYAWVRYCTTTHDQAKGDVIAKHAEWLLHHVDASLIESQFMDHVLDNITWQLCNAAEHGHIYRDNQGHIAIQSTEGRNMIYSLFSTLEALVGEQETLTLYPLALQKLLDTLSNQQLIGTNVKTDKLQFHIV